MNIRESNDASNYENEESTEEVKTGATLHLPSKEKERGKSNVRETVKDPIGGMGILCRLVRVPNLRQKEGSLG